MKNGVLFCYEKSSTPTFISTFSACKRIWDCPDGWKNCCSWTLYSNTKKCLNKCVKKKSKCKSPYISLSSLLSLVLLPFNVVHCERRVWDLGQYSKIQPPLMHLLTSFILHCAMDSCKELETAQNNSTKNDQYRHLNAENSGCTSFTYANKFLLNFAELTIFTSSNRRCLLSRFIFLVEFH